MKNEKILMVYPGWNETFTGHVLHNADGYIVYVEELPKWAIDKCQVKPGVFGKAIPIEHITPEVLESWYNSYTYGGAESLKEAVVKSEREFFIKDTIKEHEVKKGQMKSKPGHFNFDNLNKQ